MRRGQAKSEAAADRPGVAASLPASRRRRLMLGATVVATTAAIALVWLATPTLPNDGETSVEAANAGQKRHDEPGSPRLDRTPETNAPRRWQRRDTEPPAQRPGAESTSLRLPGHLPTLVDPRRQAAERAQRSLERDIERARAEAIAIGDQMAAELEQFVAEIQSLPRAEQRMHARNIHARFDWARADRLAVLRQHLPQDERNRLQIVTYERIKPLIWQLDALAAED